MPHLKSYKADKSLDTDRFVSELTDALICPICKDVVDAPVASPHPEGCEHACCKTCWQAWLEVVGECPCCRRRTAPEELHPLSRYLRSLLSGLLLHCDYCERGCPSIVKLEDLRAHVNECAFENRPLLPEHIYRKASGEDPPARMTPLTARDMISAPVDEPLNPEEHRVGALLKRLAVEKGTTVGLLIYTGGKNLYISFTPKSSTGSQSVFRKTKERRHHVISQVQEAVAGKSQSDQLAQLSLVLSKKSQEERNGLLIDAQASCHHVSTDDTVSLALDLRLSKEQTRKLRLWTKQWQVHLASEGRCRGKVKETLGEVEFAKELVQSMTTEESRCVIKPAALCLLKNPLY